MQSREERNKAARDNRVSKHFRRYEGAKWAIINAFDKAKAERWTHEALLKYRNEWILTPAYQGWRTWVKTKLEGVWDTCFALLWRELKVAYPHPDTGVLTEFDVLQGTVDLSRIDTNSCKMCFRDEDGTLHPFA